MSKKKNTADDKAALIAIQQLKELNEANAKKEKQHGLIAVYNSTTSTVVESAKVISTFASATRLVAEQGKEAAVQARIESAQKLCAKFGYDIKGPDAVTLAKELTKYICDM